jgi:hypothetical protein
MPKRIVKGHVLYTPVVTVVPGKLVFVSGILSRNSQGRDCRQGRHGRADPAGVREHQDRAGGGRRQPWTTS